MLGHAGPRGTHQVREVLMAERDSQQRTAGIFDSEVGTQFQKRESYTFVKAQAEKAGAAQKQPVPLLKIILMKLPEGRLRRMLGNMVELLPTKTADPAIVVSLDLKSRGSKRKNRKLRNRAGRQQRDHYSFGPNI